MCEMCAVYARTPCTLAAALIAGLRQGPSAEVLPQTGCRLRTSPEVSKNAAFCLKAHINHSTSPQEPSFPGLDDNFVNLRVLPASVNKRHPHGPMEFRCLFSQRLDFYSKNVGQNRISILLSMNQRSVTPSPVRIVSCWMVVVVATLVR